MQFQCHSATESGFFGFPQKLPEGKEDALSPFLCPTAIVDPIPLPTTVTASVAATALAVVGAFSPALLLRWRGKGGKDLEENRELGKDSPLAIREGAN